MPSGQSGRTLWNVPKLSNRFQVLRATGQPPAITPLCVSCVIGLPAQHSKHRHFSSKGEEGRATKWIPVVVYCKNSLWASQWKFQFLLHIWWKLQGCNLHLFHSAQLKFLLVFPPAPREPTPRLERQHAPENRGDGLGRFQPPSSTLMEITQEVPGWKLY